MTKLFGSKRYFVQGGDWGAAIAAWMAHDHADGCAAIHLNMVLVEAVDAKPVTEEERSWVAGRTDLVTRETGYSHEQSTKPQTLAIGLSESPVGVAAWILEKFGALADVPRDNDGRPDLWQAFDEDLLLTNIQRGYGGSGARAADHGVQQTTFTRARGHSWNVMFASFAVTCLVLTLSSHVALLRLTFNTASALPTTRSGGAFVGEHGAGTAHRFTRWSTCLRRW